VRRQLARDARVDNRMQEATAIHKQSAQATLAFLHDTGILQAYRLSLNNVAAAPMQSSIAAPAPPKVRLDAAPVQLARPKHL